jgi:hypothetical protein
MYDVYCPVVVMCLRFYLQPIKSMRLLSLNSLLLQLRAQYVARPDILMKHELVGAATQQQITLRNCHKNVSPLNVYGP